MSVDPGISTTDARVAGFEAAVKADSKFNYLGVQYSHDDPATAAKLVGSALQKDPDIVGVFATNLFARRGYGHRRAAGEARATRSRSSASTPGPTRSRR